MMNRSRIGPFRRTRNHWPLDLRYLAHALKGEIVGSQVLCPGPGHSASDRSLAVRPLPDSTWGFLIYSHAGDQWFECLEYVLERLDSATLEASSHISDRNVTTPSTHLWKQIWRDAESLNHLALQYLGSRGISQLPLPDIHGVLRFHARCPFGPGDKYPCLIGLLRNVLSNAPQGIHRTALSQQGEKIGRKILGRKAGAALKLWPDDSVSLGLIVGEGLETVLTAATRIEDGGTLLRPAWALGDAGNLAKFPVLAGIESLTILVDHDESGTGQQAALECSTRWTAAGRDVFRIVPNRCGDDLNDVVERTVA
jgi:putative DNA primase/helicase